MKTLHTVTKASQFPKFWTEEWLKKAISEVDLRAMSPEQKLAYEMTLSANALVIKNENKKIREAEIRKETEFVKTMLQSKKFSVEEIANFSNTTTDFVLEVQNELS